MLVHGLWQVGNIQVRVGGIAESLELGVEGFLEVLSAVTTKAYQHRAYTCETRLVPKVPEGSNTQLGV